MSAKPRDIWSVIPSDLVPALTEIKRDPEEWEGCRAFVLAEADASLRRLGTAVSQFDICWALEAGARRYLEVKKKPFEVIVI